MVREGLEKRNGINLPFSCKKYVRRERMVYPPRLHFHDYIEIVYGLTGECTCLFGDGKITVREGDLLIIINGEPHEVGIHDEWTSYIVIKALPETLISLGQTAHEYSTIFSSLKNIGELKRYFKKSEIKDFNFDYLCNSALTECTECKVGYDIAVRARILEIFTNLIRIWNDQNPAIIKATQNSDSSYLIKSAIAFIEQHYADVDRDKCAQAIGVTPTYVSKLFKKELNIQFSDFVTKVKLKEAEKLLLTTDKNITEISFLSGFSSTAYFISIFRQKHSLTPAKYRKSILI